MASMKKGDKGPGVLILQGVLNKLEYDISGIDGIFGDETDGAIKAFQEAMGLEVDGKVGNDTANAVLSELWAIGLANDDDALEFSEDDFTEV